MATIPAESRAYIKPFEGTDIICLLLDCVEWFDIDGVCSVLCLSACQALKQLPRCLKAVWKDLEPEVNSDKHFIASLGVRLLIAKTKECEVVPPPCIPPPPPCLPPPTPCTYYYNTPVEDQLCGRRKSQCGSGRRRRSSSSCRRRRRSSSPSCSRRSSRRHHHHNQPKFELSHTMHNFGNIFVNEAVYDIRGYAEIEVIDQKINKIYDLVVGQNNPIVV
ncbi:PEP [Betabaculovirus altermyunipunctae]|uniref:PEP n=1 Tax=Betabaculovirus altermyunipunctae TaxID=3051996 RepID=A0A1S5YE52_9BBAC|nr:PEP [Betabaculovirus altermyunipunctae]AQQ80285.1 PEP [Betabaculovirus altermyunipunctae]